ncbi:MAG: serpin family protein [Bacteroidota bacterium]
MKICTTVFLFILIPLLGLISCEKDDPADKEPQKIILHHKSAEILEADRAFGFELFREVISLNEEENIMISPLSVAYALGMTYNGAAGTTLEAFNEVLHFGELTTREVNESYKDLMNQLIHLDDRVAFSMANSIWYRLGYQVLSEFKQTNEDYFNAEVKEIDFSDPETLEVINQWIENNTNGKIKDMLDYIPSDAVMYLINAIYFNAQWKYEFVKEETYEGDFRMTDGTLHPADFMRVSGNFAFTSNEAFSAVELPYGDSTFSMVILLPAGENKVSDLAAQLDVSHWDSWFDNTTCTGVQVDLPKFKYGFKSLLNDPLISLGLGDAFSGSADFTRINPERNIFISRVIHQTFIDVQEEGTEAAAATIVEMRWNSSAEDSPIFFKVDKPFLYLIKENSTGALMFMGKVGKPEYE